MKLTSEQSVQKAVISALRLYGWFVQRNQQGLGATRGRPDLEAYKRGKTLFVECKAPGGKAKLSPYQKAYIHKLKEHEMAVLVADNVDDFLAAIETLEDDLWAGPYIKRLL